ncbi:hypothetical protein GCM10010182_00770 [Actinomadura cremea]|nr:hypothetical protein GCM10010182_00770 [Actinomadura cremea]
MPVSVMRILLEVRDGQLRGGLGDVGGNGTGVTGGRGHVDGAPPGLGSQLHSDPRLGQRLRPIHAR